MDFNDEMNGQYGSVERQMGQELYQAQVAASQAQAQSASKVAEAHAANHTAHAEVMKAIATWLIVFGTLTMLPVLWNLWRWALG